VKRGTLASILRQVGLITNEFSSSSTEPAGCSAAIRCRLPGSLHAALTREPATRTRPIDDITLSSREHPGNARIPADRARILRVGEAISPAQNRTIGAAATLGHAEMRASAGWCCLIRRLSLRAPLRRVARVCSVVEVVKWLLGSLACSELAWPARRPP
jgi:hypothetical protein